jgi:hypothetical protein
MHILESALEPAEAALLRRLQLSRSYPPRRTGIFIFFGKWLPFAKAVSTEPEQCSGDLIGTVMVEGWDDREVFLEKPALSGKEHQMDDERKSSKAGERAAEGLREATAKEEAKNESKMGHDLAKGADRFEERSKSSDGKSAEEKQKG